MEAERAERCARPRVLGGKSSLTRRSNGLESKIDISNENVKAALAAYEQARALVDQARAGFWPDVSLSADRIRSASGSHGFATVDNRRDIHGQQRRKHDDDLQRGRFRQLDARYLGPDSPYRRKRSGLGAGERRGARRRAAFRTEHARHRLLRAARTGSAAKAARRHRRCRTAVAEDHGEPLPLRRRGQSRCGERPGAAALQPGAADQRKNSTRPSRTRHRRVDRAAAGGFLLEPHGDARGRSDRARRSALRAAGASPGRGRSRAQGGGRQRTDRRGDCGVFSEPDAVRLGSVLEQHAQRS